MATHTYKVLGQAIPAAGVLAALYTVPGARQAIVSSLVVCNQRAAPSTFRLSAAIAGAADTLSQYTHFDTPIQANDTLAITLGATLAATDVLRVQSANGAVSFTAFGDEVS